MGSQGSSHSSRPALSPSPQVVLQIEGVPEHVQPYSTLQFSEHPSFSLELKSSQASFPFRFPSPHQGTHFEG